MVKFETVVKLVCEAKGLKYKPEKAAKPSKTQA